MVNQNETEQVTPDSSPGPEPVVDPATGNSDILSEIDRLNSEPQVALEDMGTPPTDGAEKPQEQQEAPAQVPQSNAPVAEAPAAEAPAAGTKQPLPSQLTSEQVGALQKQAAEYEQLRQRALIQEEMRTYQEELENQGYTEDQAKGRTREYIQSRQAQQDIIKRADEYGTHLQGKVAAAEHFAQLYKLPIGELPVLRQAETPQAMEDMAKKMADDRKVRDELSQLRAAQVPPQQFDNSQGEPQVASSDSSWLDRYNNGDRSPNAVAAARRATGIG